MSDSPDESPMTRCIRCSRMFHDGGSVCRACAERPTYSPPGSPLPPTSVPIGASPQHEDEGNPRLRTAVVNAWYFATTPLSRSVTMNIRIVMLSLIGAAIAFAGLCFCTVTVRHRTKTPPQWPDAYRTAQFGQQPNAEAPTESDFAPSAPRYAAQLVFVRGRPMLTSNPLIRDPAAQQETAEAIDAVNAAWRNALETARRAEEFAVARKPEQVAECYHRLVDDRIAITDVVITRRLPTVPRQICENMLGEIKAELAALTPYMPVQTGADSMPSGRANSPPEYAAPGSVPQDNSAMQQNAPAASPPAEGANPQANAGIAGENETPHPPNASAGQ